ncbi:hypothetical protein GOARA_019_00020 [Gordonia araii NBRC 100433]|uniref:Uncharacterized protein n=1 Tax=Gordonia araii NBRC 100433 TaxID=1073574 RepID=G7GYP5_9ACTN|nr:hypothetical protein GOARA_019_00020 [Gordonia araii NBRC 100433]
MALTIPVREAEVVRVARVEVEKLDCRPDTTPRPVEASVAVAYTPGVEVAVRTDAAANSSI